MVESPKKGGKTICIVFPDREYYDKCMKDPEMFRRFLTGTWERHPELFPEDFGRGFHLHSHVPSLKQDGFTMRRIRLKNEAGDVWQIRPSFMMPHMIATTDEVEKALYLRRWGVPFDALAHVFGHDAMFWYRACVSIGRNSVVGTTIKDPALLPVHVLADEKHTRIRGDKAYVTTTAAQGCVLGVGLAENAGAEALTEGYRDFREEARNPDSDYETETVTADGRNPTHKAWETLFSGIRIVLCYLHSFLSIRDRCRRSRDILRIIGEKVWNAYHSDTLAQFSQRIRRLREWAESHLAPGPLRDKVLELCGRASNFKIAFSDPGVPRTSNMIDRLMNHQDRVLYAMQYFHGANESAVLCLRSMALIWNFHPYGTRTRSKDPGRASPFEDVNGFCYHENWLQNMLVAASMRGYRA